MFIDREPKICITLYLMSLSGHMPSIVFGVDEELSFKGSKNKPVGIRQSNRTPVSPQNFMQVDGMPQKLAEIYQFHYI